MEDDDPAVTAQDHRRSSIRPSGTRLKHLAKLPPYQLIAHDIRTAINIGTLRPGDPLPPIKDLARWYARSVATIHRALTLLADDHVLEIRTGHRTRISPTHEPDPTQHPDNEAGGITMESPTPTDATHPTQPPTASDSPPLETAAPAHLRPRGSGQAAPPAPCAVGRRHHSREPKPLTRTTRDHPDESEPALTNLSAFYCEHTRATSHIHALLRRANGAAELLAILTINNPDLAERTRRALDGELHTPPARARPTEIRHIKRRLPEPSSTIFTLALHHARNRTWPTPHPLTQPKPRTRRAPP